MPVNKPNSFGSHDTGLLPCLFCGDGMDSEWKACEILETRSKPLQGIDDLVCSGVCRSHLTCLERRQYSKMPC